MKKTFANVYQTEEGHKVMFYEHKTPELAAGLISEDPRYTYIETIEITRPEIKDYWQLRCEAAERVIEIAQFKFETAISKSGINLFEDWASLKNNEPK